MTKRKRGRPTRYTPALATRICLRIAEGESLRKVCADDKIPAKATVLGWLVDGAHEDFARQYASAREAQADYFADEIVEIADDGSDDFSTGKDGEPVVDHEHIQRSRLRVDARKWVAAKLLPKKYSDRVQHTGEGGGPIVLDLEPILTKALKTAREHEQRLGSEEDQD